MLAATGVLKIGSISCKIFNSVWLAVYIQSVIFLKILSSYSSYRSYNFLLNPGNLNVPVMLSTYNNTRHNEY